MREAKLVKVAETSRGKNSQWVSFQKVATLCFLTGTILDLFQVVLLEIIPVYFLFGV